MSDSTIPVAYVLLENDHGPDCRHGSECVTCGGCDCGLVPRTCAAPTGCYSTAQAEADAQDYDRPDEYDDGGYDDYDDDYAEFSDDPDHADHAHDCDDDCDEHECQ